MKAHVWSFKVISCALAGLHGPESSGKITLTLQELTEVQQTRGTATFVDAGSTQSDNEATSVVIRVMQRERNMDGSNENMYGLCAANILALPLVALAPTIAQLVRSPGGQIGLSGVLKSQAEMVVGAYGKFFNDVGVAGEDGGWVLIGSANKHHR